MSLKNVVQKCFDGWIQFHEKRIKKIRKKKILLAEYKNLYTRRIEWKSYSLSKSEKNEIDAYYKKYYGKRIPYYWHRMYTAYTGTFRVDYFPEILFSSKLEEILNPYSTAFPLQNKSFNPQKLFANLSSENIFVPICYIENCGGTVWSADGSILTAQGAIDLLANIGEVIIKPTIDTMGGRSVRLLNIKDKVDILSGEEIQSILNTYRKDYIVQERILNHPSIAHLYSDSVNTFRVITFVTNTGIHFCPLSMRLGVDGRIVDNGGIFISVEENGTLADIGFSKKNIKKFSEHPNTHVKFKNYKIEGVTEIKKAAIKLHTMLPQLGIISWDLAFDKDGRVVVIECNTTSQSLWFPQMVTGKPMFGEYTSEFLKLISC